ncbi:MAG: type I DNA topoisomerase [Acidaminococcaceae bacterium]|nr:type I DNA topoisomerase [Acidaminococcaceae bacterium]
MAKNLIIVESPTKSKTITKFLGKNYAVKASMGHLRDLPKSTLGVDVEHDFTPKYINIRGKGDLIRELKAEAAKADKVYLATDPDREGEAISWHLAHILGLDENAPCRIEFHEITSNAVKDALKHPRTINTAMVDAQQTRRIIDRLVGYKLSPLLWRKVRKGLSAGRVQSVAVKIIADRDKAIAEFVPEEFWTLKAKLRKDVKEPLFEAEVVKKAGNKLEMHNAQEALAAETDLKDAAYKVEAAFRKTVTRKALPPFTTSTLQQEAAHKLNFTTRRTMMVAQQLYEGVNIGKSSAGLITYMRTDSTRLAAEAVASVRELTVQLFGREYCPEKPNVFSNKNNAQDAHEAIRPTSITRMPSEVEAHLTKDQYRLYKLIWERTVASQMTPAVYEQTTLTISADAYELKATGSVLTFDGHLRLADKKEMSEEKLTAVPYIASGTVLTLHKVMPAEQHFTEAPPHYTEASLVKKMEDEGIGRPSTYSPIIQTIQTRGYVARDGKKLVATELGVKVVDMLTGHFGDIINIPYSARMEDELDAIAAHQAEKEKTLADFYRPFEELLEEADKVIPKDPPPLELSGEKCELCGKDMVIREGRFGKFQACSGFPQCLNTKPLLVKIGVPCPHCGGEMTQRRTKTGRVFYGCANYPACEFTSWDKPTTQPCPVCGKQLLERTEGNGRVKYFCSDPECENAAPKRVGRKKKVTTASLLENAETEDKPKKKTRKKAAKKTKAKKTAKRKV